MEQAAWQAAWSDGIQDLLAQLKGQVMLQYGGEVREGECTLEECTACYGGRGALLLTTQV